MTTLTSDHTLSYAGVDFGATWHTESFRVRPVLDAAGRMTVYNEITITGWGYVFAATPNGAAGAANTTDESLDGMRRALMQTGGELTYKNAGVGDISVQTSLADVCFGPKPLSMSWQPTGDRCAARVGFSVKVCVVDCAGGSVFPGEKTADPLEFSYNLAEERDRAGYLRRTYSALVRVAGVRKSAFDRTLADSADRLLERITPVTSLGYRRESQSWKLSDDKTEGRLTVVDVLMPPNCPPGGVVFAEASHAAESMNSGLRMFKHTLSATYEVSRGRSRAECFEHFGKLLKDRKNAGADEVNKGIKDAKKRLVPITMSLRMAEPAIYDRQSASFTAVWRYVTDIDQLLAASGLWRPVPGGNDFSSWQTSMQVPQGARGLDGWKFDPKRDDLLVNFCNPAPPKSPAPVSNPSLRTPSPPSRRRLADAFGDERPDADHSWMEYRCGLLVEPEDATVELKALPQAAVVGVTAVPADTAGYAPPYKARGATSVLQRRAAPTLAVTLYGAALRVGGFEITPPQVVGTVGGLEAIPANGPGNYFATEVVANLGTTGLAVVAAWWSLRWLLPGVPRGAFKTPSNLLLGQVPVQGQGPAPSGGAVSVTK